MDLDPDACYRALMTRDARFDGRFFTGVRTTGIYCRPICPARTPKRENCIFFACAAAAQEAGFRPCLRCRPEASPGTPAWLGTSATVSRALRLIAEGALDTKGVDDLAGPTRRRRAPPAPTVPQASGCGTGGRRADAAHSVRQAADRRDVPANDRCRPIVGLRQRPPIQRCHPRSTGAHRESCGVATRGEKRCERRGHRADVLPFRPPYDWHAIIASGRRALCRASRSSTPCYRRTSTTARAASSKSNRWTGTICVRDPLSRRRR